MLRTVTLLLILAAGTPVPVAGASPTVGLGLRGGGGFEYYNHGPVAAWSATGQALVCFYVTRRLAVGALWQHHYLSDMDGICSGGCSERENIADLVLIMDLPVQNSSKWSIRMAVGAGYRRHTRERTGDTAYKSVNHGIDLLRFDVAGEYALTDWLRIGPWFTWGWGVFLSGEKVYGDGQTPTLKTDWGIPDLLSIQIGIAAGAVF
jgi:hypothetical protein